MSIDPTQQGAPPAMMQGPPPGAPSMMGPPPGPPPSTLDTGATPPDQSFVSTDPAQLAAIAMQFIGQIAQMDQAKLQQMIADTVMQFQAAQQQSLASAPDAIAAMVAQMAGAPPQTLDGPATTMPQDQGQQGPAPGYGG